MNIIKRGMKLSTALALMAAMDGFAVETKRDLIGEWAKACRADGMPFGVKSKCTTAESVNVLARNGRS